MALSLDSLKKRRTSLQETLIRSEDLHKDLKDRAKDIKKEIANTKGAILEIDHLIEEI